MSHTRIPDYAQFLLKTLWKTTDHSRKFGTNPNILTVCTIMVRPAKRSTRTRTAITDYT